MSEEKKEFEVKVCVSGHFTQTIELTGEYASKTPEEIQKLFEEGKLSTTIQEDGDISTLPTLISVGKVLYVDSELEYFDFDVSE